MYLCGKDELQSSMAVFCKNSFGFFYQWRRGYFLYFFFLFWTFLPNEILGPGYNRLMNMSFEPLMILGEPCRPHLEPTFHLWRWDTVLGVLGQMYFILAQLFLLSRCYSESMMRRSKRFEAKTNIKMTSKQMRCRQMSFVAIPSKHLFCISYDFLVPIFIAQLQKLNYAN